MPITSETKIEHWIVEGFDVDPSLLDTLVMVNRVMQSVLEDLRLTHLGIAGHRFGPGVTQVFILSESHSSIHTWPEDGYFYADIATCSKSLSWDSINQAFRVHFKTQSLRIRKVSIIHA